MIFSKSNICPCHCKRVTTPTIRIRQRGGGSDDKLEQLTPSLMAILRENHHSERLQYYQKGGGSTYVAISVGSAVLQFVFATMHR